MCSVFMRFIMASLVQKVLVVLIVPVESSHIILRPQDYPTSRVPGTCQGNQTQFDCKGSCISFEKVRDCHKDCADGSDELCPEGFTLCETLNNTLCGHCRPSADADSQCADRKFSIICEPELRRRGGKPCKSTANCFLPFQQMNGENDCFDWSDEDQCYLGLKKCGANTSCVFVPVFDQQHNMVSKTTLCACNPGFVGDATSCRPISADTSSTSASTGLKATTTTITTNTTVSLPSITTKISTIKQQTNGSLLSVSTKQQFIATTVLSTTQQSNIIVSLSTVVTTFSTSVVMLSSSSVTTGTSRLEVLSTTYFSSNSAAAGVNRSSTNFVTIAVTSATSTMEQALTTSTTLVTSQSTMGITSTINSFYTNTSATTTDSGAFKATSSDSKLFASSTPGIVLSISSTSATVAPKDCSAKGQFVCLSDQSSCVADSLVLDDEPDCADGSDEWYCTAGPLTCDASDCYYFLPEHKFVCGCDKPYLISAAKANGGHYCSPPKVFSSCIEAQMTGDVGQEFNCPSGLCQFNLTRPSCLASDQGCQPVLCDTSTDGGGWIVIQIRTDGSTDFFRNWTEYRNGFGSLSQKEYWIGNKYLYELTNCNVTNRLRIDLTNANGDQYTVEYDLFRVGDETSNYKLTLGKFNSTKGTWDYLEQSKGAPFGTFDKDTTLMRSNSHSCGEYWQSGWWFDPYCADTGNLNLPYNPPDNYSYIQGIIWKGLSNALLKKVKMMIRDSSFPYPDPNVATTTTVQLSTKSSEATWSYDGETGPEFWSKLSPNWASCGGPGQSPINILSGSYIVDHHMAMLKFVNFNASVSGAVLANIGITAEISFNQSDSVPTISVGGLKDVYELVSIRSHWGDVDSEFGGSEHQLTNRSFPCELQLVFIRRIYNRSLDRALRDPIGVSILAVLCEVSTENSDLQEAYFSHLKDVQFNTQNVSLPAFSPQSFLPNDTSTFFRYQGSLSAPPCSPSVIWTVFSAPILISSSQLASLRDLYSTAPDVTPQLRITHNLRPPQPIAGRPVVARSAAVAGAWGLKPSPMTPLTHSLVATGSIAFSTPWFLLEH